MDAILIIAYVVLSYWAVGQTIYANKIRFGRLGDLMISQLILGCLLGYILIPIALIKKLIFH